MDAARINAKIYAGRGKAALRLGFDHGVYRPLTAESPLGNFVDTLKAAFNAADNTYAKPGVYGKPVWFGDFDGNRTQAGDYLVQVDTPTNIKFIAAQQSLVPITCVECNRRVRVSRQGTSDGVGAVSYGGMSAANEVDVLGTALAMWPASVTFGGRDIGTMDLPAGAKQTGWMILLPPSVPVVLAAGDFVADDLGRRYVIYGAELSDLGWRLNANELHT